MSLFRASGSGPFLWNVFEGFRAMFSTRLFDLGTFAFGPLTKNRSRRRSRHQLESHAEVLEQRLVLSAVTGAASDNGHIATVEGVAEVDGRDLHVEVMVWVPNGGDAE
jgi:hypothetical protein